MLKFKENNIKLQIWDTVMLLTYRPDNRALRLLPEDIIETQLAQW
jgi:hypothetical protein